MPFTFRIYFSGLCVFVPDEPSTPTSYNVLLVNLLLPHPLFRVDPVTQKNEILDPHFPLLIFDDPVPSSRTADFRAESGDHAGRNVYLLLHDDLEILPDGAAKSEPVDVSSSGDQALANIATMAEVLPGHEHIDPGLLTEELKPNTGRVVSRIHGLSGGKLSTADLSEELVEIVPPGPVPFTPRRIAVRLAWEIECQTHMILRWRRFDVDREVTAPPIDLRWEPKAANTPVEIWIENREIDTFIGVPQSYPGNRALADFEVFFGLEPVVPAFANPPSVPIPIRLSGAGPGPQVGTLHGGKCPPTLMLVP